MVRTVGIAIAAACLCKVARAVVVAPNRGNPALFSELEAALRPDAKHIWTKPKAVVSAPGKPAEEEQWWMPVVRNLGLLQESDRFREDVRRQIDDLQGDIAHLHKDLHDADARYERESHDHFPIEGQGHGIPRDAGNVHFKGEKPPGMARQFIVPVLALIFGSLCSFHEKSRLVGKLFLFFGAQTFMNLYMKAVLSKSLVSDEQGLKGFPAAFCVTALQQLTSFALLVVIVTVSQVTPWAYKPKMLSTPKEFMMLAVFSLCFTLNIALNNFSMSILDISVNLIIRSIAPLTTLLAQMLYAKIAGEKAKEVARTEVLLMVGGVIAGLIAVLAKSQGAGGGHDSRHLALGCFVCLCSLFAASMELILASVLGSNLKLNPVDTTFYMAIPVGLFLTIPIFCLPHPVPWPGHGSVTDFQIVKEVIALNPMTFGLAILSGAFALSYNVLLYSVVQSLSAAFSAFTSNFNKAATIALSLVFGFEFLPEQPWGAVMVVGIVGNLGAFTVYGLLKAGFLTSPDAKTAGLAPTPSAEKQAPSMLHTVASAPVLQTASKP